MKPSMPMSLRKPLSMKIQPISTRPTSRRKFCQSESGWIEDFMVVSLGGADDSHTDPGSRNNSSLKAGAFTRTLESTAAGRVGNAGARLIDRHAGAHVRGHSGMDAFYKDLIDFIIKLALAL